MWIVVETIEDGERMCTAVPTKWIIGKKLLWPTRMSELQAGRKKQIDPKEDWIILDCKVLTSPIPSLQLALETEVKMSMHSTLESADESAKLERREQKKINYKAIGSTNSQIIDFNRLMESADDSAKIYSGGQKININNKATVSAQMEITDFNRLMEENVREIIDEQFVLEVPLSTGETAEIEDQATARYDLLSSSCSCSTSTEIGTIKGEVGEIKSNLISLQTTVSAELSDLRFKITALTTLQAEVKVLLEEIANKSSYIAANTDHEEFVDWSAKFPITCVEKLLELENELKDQQIKNKIIQYFGCLGGGNQKAKLRNIVKNLCTDNVYEKFTWKAASKDKQAFNMLREINSTIFGAMCRSYRNYTQHEYSTFLQGHIKQAKFRLKSKSAHNDEQRTQQ